MTFRDAVTRFVLKHHPIPEELQDPHYAFYYRDYADNLFCPMGASALDAYARGSGKETEPRTRPGKATTPAKMASIASSSAMTFNLLGNDSVRIPTDGFLPCGEYGIEYEKKMPTLCKTKPANLDAFLHDNAQKTAVFCEMKMLEWLDSPSKISDNYFSEENFFQPNLQAVVSPKRAFEGFLNWAEVLKSIPFTRYDAWQMFKHTLAIYNATSFVTADSVNRLHPSHSIAGKYNRIILANIVNEFPPELIDDEKIRRRYETALTQEREEAHTFIDTMKQCGIPQIFDSNCHSCFRVEYLSAKQFANMLDIPEAKREYLYRYYS